MYCWCVSMLGKWNKWDMAEVAGNTDAFANAAKPGRSLDKGEKDILCPFTKHKVAWKSCRLSTFHAPYSKLYSHLTWKHFGWGWKMKFPQHWLKVVQGHLDLLCWNKLSCCFSVVKQLLCCSHSIAILSSEPKLLYIPIVELQCSSLNIVYYWLCLLEMLVRLRLNRLKSNWEKAKQYINNSSII